MKITLLQGFSFNTTDPYRKSRMHMSIHIHKNGRERERQRESILLINHYLKRRNQRYMFTFLSLLILLLLLSLLLLLLLLVFYFCYYPPQINCFVTGLPSNRMPWRLLFAILCPSLAYLFMSIHIAHLYVDSYA